MVLEAVFYILHYDNAVLPFDHEAFQAVDGVQQAVVYLCAGVTATTIPY